MKKIITVVFIFLVIQNITALEITAELFAYDEAKIEKDFEKLNILESIIKSNPSGYDSENIIDIPGQDLQSNSIINSISDLNHINAPGKIPSFWFTFVLSAVGTYSLYGAIAGPIAVGIVYFSSKKDKVEVKKAMIGCLTGTIIGAGIKYAIVNL